MMANAKMQDVKQIITSLILNVMHVQLEKKAQKDQKEVAPAKLLLEMLAVLIRIVKLYCITRVNKVVQISARRNCLERELN